MIVYVFDKNTNEFLYEYSPQKNPKNPEEYLLPKFSTTIKPNTKQGYKPVFNGENWVLKADHRNKEIINVHTKVRSIMNKLGDLPLDYLLLEDYKKTDEYSQEQQNLKRQEQIDNIKSQIAEIDLKRIRAFIEPETRSDGISWLEYYTAKIVSLREKLKELN